MKWPMTFRQFSNSYFSIISSLIERPEDLIRSSVLKYIRPAGNILFLRLCHLILSDSKNETGSTEKLAVELRFFFRSE